MEKIPNNVITFIVVSLKVYKNIGRKREGGKVGHWANSGSHLLQSPRSEQGWGASPTISVQPEEPPLAAPVRHMVQGNPLRFSSSENDSALPSFLEDILRDIGFWIESSLVFRSYCPALFWPLPCTTQSPRSVRPGPLHVLFFPCSFHLVFTFGFQELTTDDLGVLHLLGLWWTL